MEKQISIMIVDDHQLIRDGITTRLSSLPYINIIGQADNGKNALEKLKTIHPDIILMDIEMPIMNGFEATQKIASLYPSIKILILSTYDEKSIILKVLKEGASGYILKNIKIEELVQAIETVMSGEQYFSNEISLALAKPSADDFLQKPLQKINNPLSNRELEVLQQISLGLSNTQISKELFISAKTVNTHRTNLMKKLDVHNVAELIRTAIQLQLI